MSLKRQTRLVNYLDSNKTLLFAQFGFKKKFTNLTTHLYNSVDNKKLCLSLSMFVDQVKAFDMGSREILLGK